MTPESVGIVERLPVHRLIFRRCYVSVSKVCRNGINRLVRHAMDPCGFICARLRQIAAIHSIMPYVFLQWNKMRLQKGDLQRMAETNNKNARKAQFLAQVRGLMLKLLIIWFVVSFGFGILLVEPLNEICL